MLRNAHQTHRCLRTYTSMFLQYVAMHWCSRAFWCISARRPVLTWVHTCQHLLCSYCVLIFCQHRPVIIYWRHLSVLLSQQHRSKGAIFTRSYPAHPNIVRNVIAGNICQDLAPSLSHQTVMRLAAWRQNSLWYTTQKLWHNLLHMEKVEKKHPTVRARPVLKGQYQRDFQLCDKGGDKES